MKKVESYKLQVTVWLALLLLAGCSPTAATMTVDNTPRAVDPFVAVANAQGTAEAAQSEANMYAGQLTATAQAPIVAITSTAAAWEMEQRYALATQQAVQQTETAAWTATAMSWTPTPNATSTVIAVNALATQQFTYNEIRRDNLAVEQTSIMNVVWAMLKAVTYLVAIVCSVGGLYTVARYFGVRAIPANANGNPQAMIDVLDGTAWDIDRAVNGQISTRQSFLRQLPQITAERQDRVTERDQMVDLRTRSAALRKLEANLQPALPAPTFRQVQGEAVDEVSLPDWDSIREWNGASLPLGVGRGGIITAQAASPHILISGKTGSGKTRFLLRTLTTASLALGYQVINLGFSDSGFGVFANHPNYHALKLDKASDIIPCLQSVYGELRARVDLIGGESRDWEHWGGTPPRPFVELVMDELGNMAEDIYVTDGANATKDLWRWVAMIANEGRKVGIRFVAALQDPTAKSMDLRFRRNCTLVSFQQGDASQSSAFMGTTGAEQLSVGRFMARVDTVTVGGGFAPTDEQITAYLSRHAARTLDAPEWLSTDFVTDKRIEADSLPLIEPTAPRDEIAEMAERIRGQWSPTLRKADVARLLGYPQTGGTYGRKTDAVIDYLTTTTTTKAQNGAEMPVLGLVGA